MKHTALVERTFNIDVLEIKVPIDDCAIEDGGISSDLPFLKDGRWQIWIDVDTGKVRNWPAGGVQRVYLKVVDRGTYILYSITGGGGWEEVASIRQNYVPNELIPGDYGDYIDLVILGDGTIENWYKKPKLDEFFKRDDEW